MVSQLALPLSVALRRKYVERSAGWSREQLAAHQARSLARLRRYAYAQSPFYRRFHAGLEQRPLAELPVLTKAALMEHFDELVTERKLRLAQLETFVRDAGPDERFHRRYVVLATSGSTGRRGIFVFNPSEWHRALVSITRPMGWAGVWTRRLAMVASTTPWHYSARVTRSLSTPLIPTLQLDAAEPLHALVRRLNAFQPDTLAAYPSILRQLAGEALAGRLRIAPRSAATSAEVLTDETRRRAFEAWGCRVYDTYGASEYAPIAAECAAGRRHLVEDGALIEIVDDAARPVPPGVRGDRVLLTVFNRFTQPLIRYEISDMLTLAQGTCPCGRPFALVAAIEGRAEDVLAFPALDGAGSPVSVHPKNFHELLERVPAASWQIVLDDVLRISLVGLSEGFPTDTVAAEVRARLMSLGAAPGAIAIERVETLARGATGKAPLIQRRANGNGAVCAR
jgi:phenylacetate-CoA ligase